MKRIINQICAFAAAAGMLLAAGCDKTYMDEVVKQAPVIESFSPASAPVGAEIIVTQEMVIREKVSDTRLSIVAGANGRDGKIVLENTVGKGESEASFTYSYAVPSLKPALLQESVVMGDRLLLSGSDLSAVEAVLFTAEGCDESHEGEIFEQSTSEIVARVPYVENNNVRITLRYFDGEASVTTPLDEIRFILDTARINKEAAERSFQGDYGHGLGKMLRGTYEHRIMGDSVFSHILSYTSGACDARMAGAMIPVMSNSGSGNQGISATVPVVVYAEENGKTEEELIRALTLSHLTVIYIKESLGRLSALCGCVVAATGSSCGITWLMGGTYRQITYAVQNMIANLTGMICDGAKPSCALKVTTGVSTAVLSAIMAMENRCVTSVEGIIDEDVDKSIRNLTRIGSQGMNETDRLVLDIMTSK